MACRELVVAAAIVLGASEVAGAVSPPPPRPEILAALQWLNFLDSKNYQKTWDEAGLLFKNGRTVSGWTAKAMTARNPLGSMFGRSLYSTTIDFSDKFPGLPDGHYAVVRFPTTFSDGHTVNRVTESVTVDEEESRWMVVRYSIKSVGSYRA